MFETKKNKKKPSIGIGIYCCILNEYAQTPFLIRFAKIHFIIQLQNFHLPPSAIKIDQTLVANLAKQRVNALKLVQVVGLMSVGRYHSGNVHRVHNPYNPCGRVEVGVAPLVQPAGVYLTYTATFFYQF